MTLTNTYSINVDIKKRMTSIVPTFGQGDSGVDAKYLGVAITTTNVTPTNASDYQWSLIKGADGTGGGGSIDLTQHESSVAPHTYGGKFELRYNSSTQSLDLVVLN